MPATAELQALKGVRDVVPPESARWEELISLFSTRAAASGYQLVIPPLIEDMSLFARGVGESTDVVSKEMYDFMDKGGRHIALRPEPTAPVVRAFIQHRPPTPWKVWYWGPNFRYERPQAGRYRQFFQLGAEALGSADAGLDVEMICLASELYAALGLRRVSLLLNSLGDGKCRPAYRALLTGFLEERQDLLCDDHKKRWRENPLRVLDCKKQSCLAATTGAPYQLDHLCPECSEHWTEVTAGLAAVGVPYTVTPRLVRGLDYYTRTTFEFSAEALEAAQNAIGGGGRYDGLVSSLGGPDTPGLGFGAGIERILIACDAEGVFPAPAAGVDAFVIDVTGGSQATVISDELRRAGVRTDRGFDARSMRAQMKMADRSGAAVAVIVGEEEAAEGSVTVRPLRGGGQQLRVPRGELARAVRQLLEGAPA